MPLSWHSDVPYPRASSGNECHWGQVSWLLAPVAAFPGCLKRISNRPSGICSSGKRWRQDLPITVAGPRRTRTGFPLRQQPSALRCWSLKPTASVFNFRAKLIMEPIAVKRPSSVVQTALRARPGVDCRPDRSGEWSAMALPVTICGPPTEKRYRMRDLDVVAFSTPGPRLGFKSPNPGPTAWRDCAKVDPTPPPRNPSLPVSPTLATV